MSPEERRLAALDRAITSWQGRPLTSSTSGDKVAEHLDRMEQTAQRFETYLKDGGQE